MAHKIYTHIFRLGFVILILFAISCKSKNEPDTKEDVILPVRSIRVGDNASIVGKNFPARTKPEREVDISFRVGGHLVALNVEEGQHVKKGQVLAQIDKRDFKIKLESAKADYELALVEKERYERLLKKQSVAENEYDIKLAAFRTKEAHYADAQNALKDATVYAPFSGYIGEVRVENHEDVRASQTILTLLDLSDIEVQFFIPESMLFEPDDISGFEVYFENLPDSKFKANLKEVARVATAEGFPVTLTLDAKILSSGNNENIAMAAGFTVRVNILYKEYSETNKVIVPITAVLEANAENETIVWVLNRNTMTVQKRKVSVQGFASNSTLEIAEGLENGEWIVTAGIHKLKDGQKVKDLPEKL
jgi:RND family efflux transporter MFP subunit